MVTRQQVEPAEPVLREAHLRDYWKIVWQGRWTVAAVFVVTLGIAAVLTFLQTPIYRATSTIEIQPQAKGVAVGQDVSGMGAAGYGWFAEEKYHNTQVEIIKSRDVAERVVRTLALRSHPEFSGLADPVEAFRRKLQVVPRRETGLIEISILGPNPDEITHWVNQVAVEYVDRNLEKAAGNVTRAINTIRGQMAEWERDVSQAESQRFDTLADTSLNSEEQEEIVRDKLRTFNADLTKIQIELNQLAETLSEIRDMQERGADLMSMPEIAGDPTIEELHRSKVDLERRLESAKVELRPGHPTYEKTVSELQKVHERINERTSVMLGTLQTRYDLLVQQEAFLKGQIRQVENSSVQVARAASDYEAVKTKADTSRHVLDLIYKTMNEVQLGLHMLSNNVSILDEASRPLYPIKPRKRLNLFLGAVVGGFLGIAAAFFLDYLDNTFRTPEDIENRLSLAVLGVIPKVLGEDKLAHRAFQEACQSLRTSVIFSSKNRQRRVVLFTSTGPQEGKSSTVANLARTLASTGEAVLIVDCDLRRPTQHALHGLERDQGLTNYLAAPVEQTDWTPYVKQGAQPTLHVLSCGPVPPSPPELLGSERFRELLASLREEYDWVLLDSPPATSLTDASLLAAVADMVVLVVQHNKTDRDVTARTLQRLREVNAEVVGAVLNNVDLERTYNKDYYYAGYYFEDGEKGSRKKRRVERKAQVG
jgi:capsular exopolysaccharide synthesis family protein